MMSRIVDGMVMLVFGDWKENLDHWSGWIV